MRRQQPSAGAIVSKAQISRVFEFMLCHDDDDELERFFSFIEHAKIDLTGVTDPARQLLDVCCAHYCVKRGAYDAERLGNDLATWAPLAKRIDEYREQYMREGKL